MAIQKRVVFPRDPLNVFQKSKRAIMLSHKLFFTFAQHELALNRNRPPLFMFVVDQYYELPKLRSFFLNANTEASPFALHIAEVDSLKCFFCIHSENSLCICHLLWLFLASATKSWWKASLDGVPTSP